MSQRAIAARNTVFLWLENCLCEPDLALMIRRIDCCNTAYLEVKLAALKSSNSFKMWLPTYQIPWAQMLIFAEQCDLKGQVAALK